MKSKLHLSFILLVIPAIFSEHRYCQLGSCPGRSHTLCAFETDHYGPACWNPFMARISDDEILLILLSHERIDIEWDEELADIAQRWAYQCPIEPDECRNVDRFNVTQRIYARELPSLYPNQRPVPDLDIPIAEWYNLENQATPDYSHISSAEYTLVGETGTPWGNANRIGCGKVRTNFDYLFRLYFVCNYGHV